MMKRLLYLLALASILILSVMLSCDKDESKSDPCDVSNPIEELAWLKATIDDLSEYSYIMIADYNGETVFYFGNCNPLANSVSSVYNCNGDFIGYTNDIRSEITNDRLLWKHEDSECNFND